MEEADCVVPRRFRILLWAVPVLGAQWIAFTAIEPSGGRGVSEYVSLGFFLGSIFGQATLAAAWAALGPGPVGWRVPLSLLWVVMLPIAIAVNIHANGGPSGAAVVLGGCLLGQWLIVQLPLWLLAIGYGLRLRHADDWEKIQHCQSRQFSLRHLMVVTALVGVVLGIGRLSAGWLMESYSRDHEAPVFAFLAVAAVVLTVPLLLAGLLRHHAVPAVVLCLALIGLVTFWEVTLWQIVVSGAGGPGPDTGHFVGMNGFTAATVLLGVLLVRLNGYQMSDPKQSGSGFRLVHNKP